MKIEIDSKIQILDVLMNNWNESDIKNEPMLFNCDFLTSLKLGGWITGDFLAHLPQEWQAGPLVIDSRVHMLMPGWYPCIPGWHHDDVPRTRLDGQPNYEDGQIRSKHIIALINADVCATEFAIGTGEFEFPEEGVVYEKWNKDVDAWALKKVVKAESRKLIMFDDRTWHRGTAATGNGWRFFIRASIHFDTQGNRIARPGKLANEVRRQCQVYMDNINSGW